MGWKRPTKTIETVIESSEGDKIAEELIKQFDTFHLIDFRDVPNVDIPLKEQQLAHLKAPKEYLDIPLGTIIFNPSGSGKCDRELYYKFKETEKDEQKMYPFQKRWTRNSSAVHEAVQKDFLYMEELMEDPSFVIAKTEDGLPMWEENVKTVKVFNYNGVTFGISGMMDGILLYKPENRKIGFEFKTKSNSVAQVGAYKMKEAAPSHKTQCVAYSLMFDLNDFILMYEAVAKDQWNKGAEARADIRAFFYSPTEEDKQLLLKKFSEVVKAVENNNIPGRELDKCLFCQYKNICMNIK